MGRIRFRLCMAVKMGHYISSGTSFAAMMRNGMHILAGKLSVLQLNLILSHDA